VKILVMLSVFLTCLVANSLAPFIKNIKHLQHIGDQIRNNIQYDLRWVDKFLFIHLTVFPAEQCTERLDSFQENEIKALKKHWMWMPFHRPMGRPDQCLLHQCFGFDLFISQIDLCCSASRHLYNIWVVVWLRRGRAYEGPLYKLNYEK